jgi:hypothetical protein
MLNRLQKVGAFAALVMTLVLTGCNGLDCGNGTHEAAGQCLPNILTACGPGTTYAQGFCVLEDDTSIGIATNPADIADDTRDADEDVPTLPVGSGTD